MTWTPEKHTEARSVTLSWEGEPAARRQRLWLIGILALSDALDEIERLNMWTRARHAEAREE